MIIGAVAARTERNRWGPGTGQNVDCGKDFGVSSPVASGRSRISKSFAALQTKAKGQSVNRISVAAVLR